MERILIKRIWALMLICPLALSVLMAQPHSNAQRITPNMQSPYLTLNPKIVDAFSVLDSIFPMRYLINEEPHIVLYHVGHYFKNEADYNRNLPKLTAIMEELKQIPAYRLYTSIIDTVGQSAMEIAVSPKTERYEQTDFLKMSISPRIVVFEYTASVPQMKMPTTSNQEIANHVDELLQQYIRRGKVKKEPISFDGNQTNYWYLSFLKKYDSTYRCSGTRYIVPNCTEKDFERFYRLFRGYALVSDVSVASNDIYNWYEATAISVHQDNRRPLMVAAALKGTDLYLIRCEGEANSQGWLPRAWTEDDPVWDNSKVRRYIYINSF